VHVSAVPATVELVGLPGPARPNTTMRIGATEADVVLRAEGPHNAQNACGAAAVALSFGFEEAVVAAGLAKVSPAFGRGQTFDVEGRLVTLQLVKNPAGFRQTLRTLDAGAPAALVIAINDEYADGRDVSWLWDVDFAALRGLSSRRSTSGTRAADMAVRLRYDEIEVIEIEPDLEKAVRAAVESVAAAARVVVFSTYTAMWELHAVLQRIGTAG
jgi:UDP-N-acetylmuramyl tripeptide synthase